MGVLPSPGCICSCLLAKQYGAALKHAHTIADYDVDTEDTNISIVTERQAACRICLMMYLKEVIKGNQK